MEDGVLGMRAAKERGGRRWCRESAVRSAGLWKMERSRCVHLSRGGGRGCSYDLLSFSFGIFASCDCVRFDVSLRPTFSAFLSLCSKE